MISWMSAGLTRAGEISWDRVWCSSVCVYMMAAGSWQL